MQRNEFLTKVGQRTGLAGTEAAEKVTGAVLCSLSHRLPQDEAKHVQAQLPNDMDALWSGGTWESVKRFFKPQDKMSLNEFLEHVRKDADLETPEQAEQTTLAVFAVLKEAISPGEVKDVEATLPSDLEKLWKAA